MSRGGAFVQLAAGHGSQDSYLVGPSVPAVESGNIGRHCHIMCSSMQLSTQDTRNTGEMFNQCVTNCINGGSNQCSKEQG